MPMDLKRYPPDWKEVSRWIRTVRAMGRCECAGECGGHSGTCSATNHQLHPETGSLVVLTVAHLWRGPCAEHHALATKCSDPSHLKAMCQACHLRYDLPHHIANRARTRHELKATGDLFDLEHLSG
jgi:hypothetical protein